MHEWHSDRFGCIVRLTQHAIERMKERNICHNLIGELIENGTIRKKDKKRCGFIENILNVMII